MRPVQYFSEEYLEKCKEMTPEQIIQFLDDFRILHGSAETSKSKLISIKIPENLLNTFKTKSKLKEVPYQTQIKKLMKDWVSNV
jgi:predicted DNA binding CopG/RHH family protein